MRAFPVTALEEAPRRFTAATYNIHRCYGADGKYEPDRIVQVIRSLKADIIGLQEVDSRISAGFGMTQLEYITMFTKYKSLVGPCIRDLYGCYGNALLTKLPITDYRLIDLSVKGREPRGAIDVDLEADGITLRVIVTHLGRNAAERRIQAKKLVEHIGKPADVPVVLMGDFNEWFPLSGNLRYLYEKIGRTKTKPSFPSRLPVFSLDRIWLLHGGKNCDQQVHSNQITKLASDHLPVVMKFQI